MIAGIQLQHLLHETPRVQRVRETAGRYEDEGSVREARGAISIAPDAWWSVALAAPHGDAPAGAGVMLRLERHGPASAAPGDRQVTIVLPAAEVDALLALLGGVLAQARRDGVLPPG